MYPKLKRGFSKTINRKYYKKRLWKITTVLVDLGAHGYRFVKHYDRRCAIGKPWESINHAKYEFSGFANIGGN